jgi:hypothetical protein
MTRRWRKPTGVVLQKVTAIPLGRARLPPSRAIPSWEGEAPAEPNNTLLGRARLLPSRTTLSSGGRGSCRAVRSHSQRGKLPTIRQIQRPHRRSAQQELRPPKWGNSGRSEGFSSLFRQHLWQRNLQLRAGFCVDPKKRPADAGH